MLAAFAGAALAQDVIIDRERADRAAPGADIEARPEPQIPRRVSGVTIGGDTEGDIDLLRYYAAKLTTEDPLTRATLERQLSLISDIPGLETRIGLSAPDADGAVRLGLELHREPWEYEIGLNNSGPDSLGETQVSATLVRNALFRLGDQTRFTFGADTSFNRFQLAALSHRQPVGHDGASITSRFSTLTTEPGGGLRGRANAAGLTFSYPWIRSYRRNLTLAFGLDGLNSDRAQLGGVVSEERTRVARASAAWLDARAARAWAISATLSQGIDGLGARPGAPTTVVDFTKLNMQLVHTTAFSRLVRLRAALSAQLAGAALPASERFTLGGAAFGRAFSAATTSGDSGYGASAEVSWRVRRGWLSEAYVFADGGQVWIEERAPFPERDDALSSAGVGVRLNVERDTRLDLELAQPLDQPDSEDEGLRFRFAVSAAL